MSFFVAQMNIDRLRALLKVETDAVKRETIARLLEAETAKLDRGAGDDHARTEA